MAPRKRNVVCTCVSYGCGKFSFKNAQGEMQQGVLLASSWLRNKHINADFSLRNASLAETRNSQTRGDESTSESEESESEECESESEEPQSEGSESESQGSHTSGTNHLAHRPNESNNMNQEHENSLTRYDCASFHQNKFQHTQPTVLHSTLIAVLSHILNHSSIHVSNYILRCQANLIRITLSHGILNQPHREILHSENTAIEAIPTDIRTIIRWLQINPMLNIFVCCPTCFAIYSHEKAPESCTHFYIQNDSQLANKSKSVSSLPTSDLSICAQPLFKHNVRNALIPIREYATQDLFSWIARLFSRFNIEDALDLTASRSRKPYNHDCVEDIQDSRVWKDFTDFKGNQYTSSSSNLVFGMFTDGINPYGNRQAGKHVSITFIILVCLSLPIELRHQPENIFLVGIAPGPQEPSLELVNWILIPLVKQLITLWQSGIFLSQTYRNSTGRHIFGALLPVFADLPALRRTLGFASATATRLCSYCLIEKKEIKNIDPSSWKKRTLHEHRSWATEFDQTTSRKIQERLLLEPGVRYSVLLELEYWDIINYHVIDSMHNLLLGLFKWHCHRFWCMSDKIEAEPQHVSTSELRSLKNDAQITINSNQSPPTEFNDTDATILNMCFNSNTDPSDATFDPLADDDGWDGKWTAPSDDIVLDSESLPTLIKHSLAFMSPPGLNVPSLFLEKLHLDN